MEDPNVCSCMPAWYCLVYSTRIFQNLYPATIQSTHHGRSLSLLLFLTWILQLHYWAPDMELVVVDAFEEKSKKVSTNTVHEEFKRYFIHKEESQDDNDDVFQDADWIHHSLMLKCCLLMVPYMVLSNWQGEDDVPQVEVADSIHNTLVEVIMKAFLSILSHCCS